MPMSPRSLLLAALCASLPASTAGCGGTPAASTAATPLTPTTPAPRAWIARSDANARILLDVEVAFSPESATSVGEESADERTVDSRAGLPRTTAGGAR